MNEGMKGAVFQRLKPKEVRIFRTLFVAVLKVLSSSVMKNVGLQELNHNI